MHAIEHIQWTYFGSKAKQKLQNGVVKNDFIINPICDKCRDGK